MNKLSIKSLAICTIISMSGFFTCQSSTPSGQPLDNNIKGKWSLSSKQQGIRIIKNAVVVSDTFFFPPVDSSVHDDVIWSVTPDSIGIYRNFDTNQTQDTCYTLETYAYTVQSGVFTCSGVGETRLNTPGSLNEIIEKSLYRHDAKLFVEVLHREQFTDSTIESYAIDAYSPYIGNIPPDTWHKTRCP